MTHADCNICGALDAPGSVLQAKTILEMDGDVQSTDDMGTYNPLIHKAWLRAMTEAEIISEYVDLQAEMLKNVEDFNFNKDIELPPRPDDPPVE